MFGLFFLVVVPLLILGYVVLVYRIASKTSIWRKTVFFVIAYGLPLSYPFLYKYSSLYKEFKRLCSNTERTKVYKSIKVDNFQTDYFSGGYKALLEKPYKGFIYKGDIYTRGINFNSNECKKACNDYFSAGCSELQCLNETKHLVNDEFTVYIKEYDGHESTNLINSYLQTDIVRLVSKKYGILAETYNYTFYPYGHGWATILGASSGSAPSERCESDARFNFYEITPPNNEYEK